MKFFRAIYVHKRFYVTGVLLVALFIIAAFVPALMLPARLATALFLALLLVDGIMLFGQRNGINARRVTAERYSNGDENRVELIVENNYAFRVQANIIDELPAIFQIRDFSIEISIEARSETRQKYLLRPVKRGEYHFGKINVFVRSFVGLLERRYAVPAQQMVKVYPSFFRLKNVEFLSFADIRNRLGLKKIRRMGYNKEFEQIKDFEEGDEIKSINWKASARRHKLMVNQYQDERAQHIYCAIDMGRSMKMPFNEMTLLDYAINASLTLSQVVLKNNDRIGLITYADTIHSVVPSDRKNTQLTQILETLYNQETQFNESGLDTLYTFIKRKINNRSLFIFFTNYESIYSLERQLPTFIQLSRSHLVLIVSFINTEVEKITQEPVSDISSIYRKTIAEKFLFEKSRFMNELTRHGIQTLLTAPENLTVDSVNKYLEIKARGLI